MTIHIEDSMQGVAWDQVSREPVTRPLVRMRMPSFPAYVPEQVDYMTAPGQLFVCLLGAGNEKMTRTIDFCVLAHWQGVDIRLGIDNFLVWQNLGIWLCIPETSLWLGWERILVWG